AFAGIHDDPLLDALLEENDAESLQRSFRPPLETQAIQKRRFGRRPFEQTQRLMDLRGHRLPLGSTSSVVELEQPLGYRTAVERTNVEGGIQLPSQLAGLSHRRIGAGQADSHPRAAVSLALAPGPKSRRS